MEALGTAAVETCVLLSIEQRRSKVGTFRNNRQRANDVEDPPSETASLTQLANVAALQNKRTFETLPYPASPISEDYLWEIKRYAIMLPTISYLLEKLTRYWATGSSNAKNASICEFRYADPRLLTVVLTY